MKPITQVKISRNVILFSIVQDSPFNKNKDVAKIPPVRAIKKSQTSIDGKTFVLTVLA
jgi:hypothetical protein